MELLHNKVLICYLIDIGLGLFIVKTLIDKYDGQISIKNRIQDDSQGTQFIISLNSEG